MSQTRQRPRTESPAQARTERKTVMSTSIQQPVWGVERSKIEAAIERGRRERSLAIRAMVLATVRAVFGRRETKADADTSVMAAGDRIAGAAR